MFIAALFTIANSWKRPKCLSTDEWIKKMYIHAHTHISTTERYSAIKKNEIMPFAALHGLRDYCTKGIMSDRGKQISMTSLLCEI